MERYLSLVMAFFLAAGAFDKAVLKGKLGLGREFERGIHSVGALTLSMAGIMCVAPVMGKILMRAAAPFFRMVGADPAMIAGAVFAIDMGGLPLAAAMTESGVVRLLSGAILSSMMGATVVFLIPVSMTVCRKEDLEALSMGIVLGLISIPAGLAAGAAVAGIPFRVFWSNSVPVAALCIALSVCLIRFKNRTLACFKIFGNGIRLVSLSSFVLAAMEEMLDITVVPGMAPLGEQLEVIGMIGVTLAGAYPMLAVLTRILAPLLDGAARLLRVKPAAVEGMVAALANPLPVFDKMAEMDEKGKVIAVAFTVPAMAVFGDHLGYINTAMPEAAGSMIAAKLTAAAAAVILAETVESAAGFRRRKR